MQRVSSSSCFMIFLLQMRSFPGSSFFLLLERSFCLTSHNRLVLHILSGVCFCLFLALFDFHCPPGGSRVYHTPVRGGANGTWESVLPGLVLFFANLNLNPCSLRCGVGVTL